MKYEGLIAITILILLMIPLVMAYVTTIDSLLVRGDTEIGGNITSVDGINFEKDTANHRIDDNTTCIIITGDTSELTIC